MIKQLKLADRWNGTLLLGIMSAFSFSLSLIRFWITGSKMYVFLNWNLFLAFIPWMLSTGIVIYNCERNKVTLLVLLLSWLLFFPNSPYILTDLFHLKKQSSAPIWFDWALILSFAWTGLMFGFTSLRDIENILRLYVRKQFIIPIAIILLFMAGFGVYIGRFLRWNSWDIINSPLDLGEDIFERILHPLYHARTWAITMLNAGLLNMMYFSSRILKN